MTARQFRWALELTGEGFEIADATALYGENSDPEIQNLDAGERTITLLTSPQLDTLTSSDEVEQVARRLLGLVNGVLFVMEPSRVPLAPVGVRERKAEGGWIHYGRASAHGRARARAVGVAIVGGVPSPEHMRPSPALRWSAEAQSDDGVGDVLKYLSGTPEWFNFYKAFELMREDINQRLGGQHRQEQIGWPAKDILDHFTCSAQVYRHSPAKWPQGYSPANAMHLREATQFIQSCAATWLAWRFP